MEGAHDYASGGPSTDHSANSCLHFLRCLFGKGEREYFFRTYSFVQEVGYSACQYPGLSGTGSRDNQDRTFRLLYSVVLLRIQPFEYSAVFITHNAAKLAKIFVSSRVFYDNN